MLTTIGEKMAVKLVDTRGIEWSLNPEDKAFYDVSTGAFCINLEKGGVLEGQKEDSVYIKIGESLKDPALVDKVLRGIDEGVRKYYGRGSRI